MNKQVVVRSCTVALIYRVFCNQKVFKIEDEEKREAKEFVPRPGNDFQVWALRVISYLESKDLSKFVAVESDMTETK